MSPLAHALISWLVAWTLCRRPIDRRMVVIVGVAADIDGVFVLFNQGLFITYHHSFGHSYVFGLPMALTAALLAGRSPRVGLAAFAAFSLHLVADIVGSSWAVQPFFPFSAWSLTADGVLSGAVIYGIVDPLVALVAFSLTAVIVYRHEVSPLEVLSARVDRLAVFAYVYPLKHRCGRCGRRALARCRQCDTIVCLMHLQGFWRSKCAGCPGPLRRGGS